MASAARPPTGGLSYLPPNEIKKKKQKKTKATEKRKGHVAKGSKALLGGRASEGGGKGY